MQRGAAMEMLCFDQKIDAEEAKQRGLVTNVFPCTNFKGECMSRLNLFASKPATTLEATKRLIRQREMEQMLKLSISFVNTFALCIIFWVLSVCLHFVPIVPIVWNWNTSTVNSSSPFLGLLNWFFSGKTPKINKVTKNWIVKTLIFSGKIPKK